MRSALLFLLALPLALTTRAGAQPKTKADTMAVMCNELGRMALRAGRDTTVAAPVGSIVNAMEVTTVPPFKVRLRAVYCRPGAPALDVSRKARWSSRDTSMATVSKTGLVTIKRAGMVTIDALYPTTKPKPIPKPAPKKRAA